MNSSAEIGSRSAPFAHRRKKFSASRLRLFLTRLTQALSFCGFTGMTDNGSVCSLPVGGQAVMEGVVMRNERFCALAVRLAGGGILAERRPWKSLGANRFAKLRFVRGFPVMLETLVNGIGLLARSAELADEDEEALGTGMVLVSLAFAIALGIGLFVVLPHFMAVLADSFEVGRGMRGFAFHLWDGAFKFGIFFAYLLFLSRMGDIHRMLQYHGAEHKVIAAWETGGIVSAQEAAKKSRLHPRCGTTFLVFLLALATLAHAALVPPLLSLWSPVGDLPRHAWVIPFKILLIIPVSSVAYEFIRGASGTGRGWLARLGSMPGLALQLCTTREPNKAQLEVAVVALAEALGETYSHRFETPGYAVLE